MDAVNSIILGEDTGGKGRVFQSRFLQAGLVKYSFGVCLLTKETINKFVNSFIGCPVRINHKDITDENAKDERVGVVSDIWFNDNDGWFWCKGVIFDDKAIELINNGYTVSCQYEITEYSDNIENKLHNGIPYDKEILNGKFEHLAIVDNPRYEGALIAVNANVKNEFKEEEHPRDDEGKFTNGGDSKENDKNTTEFDKYFETNKTGMSMYDDVIEDEYYAEAKSRFPKIVKMSPDEYIELVNKGFNEIHRQNGEPTHTKEQLIESRTDKSLEKLNRKYGNVKLDMPMISYETRENGDIEMDFQEGIHRAIVAKQKGLKYMPVAIFSTKRYEEKVPNEKLKENLEKITKDYAVLKATNEYKPILDYIEDYDERNDKMNEETKNVFERLISALKAKNEADEKDKKAENEEVDKRDIIRQIMAIAGKEEASEDVKIIAKLAEKLAYDKSEAGTADNKAKNEDDKKEDKEADNCRAKNDKVDKRELIDQVGGILKGKVDDEIIRTIIGKLEEIAYDKSEAGTADNKAKNDDDEYKKLKDDVEKDVENCKAKNSMEALKDLFFEGEVKQAKSYMSQKERIELGKQLF